MNFKKEAKTIIDFIKTNKKFKLDQFNNECFIINALKFAYEAGRCDELKEQIKSRRINERN